MKLYDSIGPNPHTVRMFAAEKGFELELQPVDIVAGECRREPYLSINPMGTTPVLVLPSGQILSETIAICEYIETAQPAPPLIGSTPDESAETRMWVRRLDLNFVTPLTLGFRAAEGRALFESRVRLVREDAAPDLKAIAFDMLDWLEQHFDSQQPFLCGQRFTLADILLFCFVSFSGAVGMDLLSGRTWLSHWHERVSSRPSAQA